MSEADDLRLADAVEEYRALLRSGRRPSRRAFLDAHADIAGPLSEYLEALEFVQSGAADLGLPPGDGPSATPLGDFRLLREVGRGGMGVVYEAEQLSLGRRVALKVLPFAAALDPRRLQRFRNEAQAAAQLRHPNIVPVHAVGCERGVHYYAMDYVEGETLADVVRQQREHVGRARGAQTTTPGARAATETGCPATRSGPPPDFLRAAARWMAQAAEAIEHAHQFGVIHRDLKPANLMVDVAGTLWVTDFGLAQVLDDTRLTRSGDVLGTLRYMSPEQALGDAASVGPRSDVYALGATLYELLTLEPVVGGYDRHELLRQLGTGEPRAPRRLNPAVPVELETIALKALARAPEERYATASELAEDLRRFLDDRSIRARPPTLTQRVRRWARRHAAVATTVVTASFVLLIVVVVAAILVAVNQHEAAASAEAARRQIAAALAEQQAARDAADEARRDEQAHRRRLEELLERQQVAQALRLLAADDPHGALRATVESLQLVRGDAAREEMHRYRFAAALRACPQPVRVWFHDGAVRHAEFSRDGSRVLTASFDGTARVWNTATGQPETPPLRHGSAVWDAAFSPDGRRVLTVGAEGVRVWDADTGQPVGVPLRYTAVNVVAVFSPDGSRTLIADSRGAVRLWNATTGRVDLLLEHPASGIHHVAFRPDGVQIATASADGKVRTWDARTGNLVGSPMNLGSAGRFVAYRPDGQVLVAGAQAGATLWEAATGKQIAVLEHLTHVERAAFSADGRRPTARDGQSRRHRARLGRRDRGAGLATAATWCHRQRRCVRPQRHAGVHSRGRRTGPLLGRQDR